MDKDAVREAIAHEIAPLLIRCAEMRVQLDLTEDALPISLDKRTRDACRVRLMMRRAELEAVIAALQGNELIEKVMRLADERLPQWRT
jgi:hypothetical protein